MPPRRDGVPPAADGCRHGSVSILSQSGVATIGTLAHTRLLTDPGRILISMCREIAAIAKIAPG